VCNLGPRCHKRLPPGATPALQYWWVRSRYLLSNPQPHSTHPYGQRVIHPFVLYFWFAFRSPRPGTLFRNMLRECHVDPFVKPNPRHGRSPRICLQLTGVFLDHSLACPTSILHLQDTLYRIKTLAFSHPFPEPMLGRRVVDGKKMFKMTAAEVLAYCALLLRE